MAEPRVSFVDAENVTTEDTQETVSNEGRTIIHVSWKVSQQSSDDEEIRKIAKRSQNKWMDENPA